MIANTIDEVIQHLDEIILTSKEDQSTLGYFAALYRKVTVSVRDRLDTGYFKDDERMEKLDVVFANRYLQAYSDYMEDNPVTKSWEVTFSESKNNWLIVLQHLLLGMNAHINLDLGIAAAEISKGSNIEDLHTDFNKINELLAGLVDEVQRDLAEIWPTLFIILKLVKKVDDFLVNFSMNLARDGAWKFATELAAAGSIEWTPLISERDHKIGDLANMITNQGFLVGMLFKIIRWGEKGTIADRILALED